MSAVYLHNALYTPEVMESRGTFPHSRNLSTVSSATLHTNTTLHSYPTEPLLPSDAPGIPSYYEILSRSSRHTETSPIRPQWDQRTQLEENVVSEPEKKGYWQSSRRKKRRRVQWLKFTLEAIIGIWSVYNTARYFLAFTIYQSIAGQTISLVSGVSTGLSFAFLACAIVLSLFQPNLISHGVPYQTVLSVRSTLQYITSILLFAPAAINFAITFPSRDSEDIQMNLNYRCHVEIDTIWSISYGLCNGKSPGWGVWVTLSMLRLLITTAIIIAFHFITNLERYRAPPVPSRGRRKHHHNRSDSFSCHSPNPQQQITGLPFPAMTVSRLTEDQRQVSDSTLSARTKSSQRNQQSTRSRSSGSSSEAIAAEVGNNQLLSHFQYQNIPLPVVHENEGDINGFVDRFRSLISQIHRETEEGLEFARSEETSSRHTIESLPPHGTVSPELISSDDEEMGEGTRQRLSHHDDDDHDDDDFYLPSRTPSLGYNEFGQPYPADQQIRMLNGFIRRMPTIESMGSREMASSVAPSSLYARDPEFDKRGSMQTNRSNSRPPTRNTLAWTEYTNSEPPSRANSLSVQVERLAAMGILTSGGGSTGAPGGQDASEIGELLAAGGLSVRRVETPGCPSLLGLGGLGTEPVSGGEGYSSSSSGSRSTNLSYHTATTGSAKTGAAVIMEEVLAEGSSASSLSPNSSSISPPLPPKDS